MFVDTKSRSNILELIKFEGSLKNIPIASQHAYKVRLFHFTNALIQKMRWRAFYFEKHLANELPNNNNIISNDCLNSSKLNIVGRLPFTTNKCAPVCHKLLPFESELFELINSISFKHKSNNFQRNLRNQINSIKKSNKLIVFADKTNNLYKIGPKIYYKLLNNSHTKDYKKCDKISADWINSCAQEIYLVNVIVS